MDFLPNCPKCKQKMKLVDNKSAVGQIVWGAAETLIDYVPRITCSNAKCANSKKMFKLSPDGKPKGCGFYNTFLSKF